MRAVPNAPMELDVAVKTNCNHCTTKQSFEIKKIFDFFRKDVKLDVTTSNKNMVE